MISFVDLIALFSSDYNFSSSQEDFEVFEQHYVLKNISIPDETTIKDFSRSVLNRDKLTIHITFDGSDPIVFTDGTEYIKFKDLMLLGIAGQEDGYDILFKITINKSVTDNSLALYSLNDFENYLQSFSVSELLEFFAEKIKMYSTVVFKSNEIITESWSASLGFVNSSWSGVTQFRWDSRTRSSRLKSIKSSTHAVMLSDLSIVSEDFQFLPHLHTTIQSIFDKLNLATIIMATFDLTTVVENNLTFRLNGYKGIDGTVDFATLNVNGCLNEYAEIYSWINESGNLNDKLGLARNIISLHLNSSNDLTFTGSMYSSVLSGYKVYEKQNIKQYIEIRNKLSDQLLDYNRRANSIVEGFASTFQKSALSVLTLFASIIALRVLGTTNPSADLVLYSVCFSFLILLISLVYMFISKSEANEQKSRYELSYKNFKERYTDLLNVDDIQKILNHDKDFDADISYIDKKIKLYVILWWAVLILITAFICIYLVNEKYHEINVVMTAYPNI
jgi:hypothetical protein